MMHYPDVVIEFLHLFSSDLVEMASPAARTFLMEAAASGGLTRSSHDTLSHALKSHPR